MDKDIYVSADILFHLLYSVGRKIAEEYNLNECDEEDEIVLDLIIEEEICKMVKQAPKFYG